MNKPAPVENDETDSKDLPLASLLLDVTNPRFGDPQGKENGQRWVLDKIVEEFGVDDLLSSLAVNGYFNAEPLVVRPSDDSFVVVEGNRRLAACLMLTGDSRAENQKTRAEKFRVIWEAHEKPALDPVPVIVFATGKSQKSLLSYLGVRHIASSKSWDSYAKAAWVARVIGESDLAVRDVATMIGDQHRTIERLLQGYYVVHQLQENGEFRPEDSVRKGRGSVTEYPFSWVYTILGYKAARQYLGIADDETGGAPKKDPISKENLAKGGALLRAMFGDAKAGKSAAVTDSRQLGDLASVVVSPEKLALLESGKSVDEIFRLTQPTEDQLRQGLAQTRETLSTLVSRIEEEPIPPVVAAGYIEPAGRVRNLAAALEQKLKNQAAS